MTLEEAGKKITANEIVVQMAYDSGVADESWHQFARLNLTLSQLWGGRAKFDDFMPTTKTKEEQEEELYATLELMIAQTPQIEG